MKVGYLRGEKKKRTSGTIGWGYWWAKQVEHNCRWGLKAGNVEGGREVLGGRRNCPSKNRPIGKKKMQTRAIGWSFFGDTSPSLQQKRGKKGKARTDRAGGKETVLCRGAGRGTAGSW